MRFRGIYSVAIAGIFIAFSLPHFAFASSVCPYTWAQNLKVGSTGTSVQNLQLFLNGDIETRIAASGPGSPGMETTRYGSLTAKAVSKFQEKYAADILVPSDLTQGTGTVGAMTRAKLNQLCSLPAVPPALGATSTPPQIATSSTDMLTITVGTQPAHTIAPANALYVPFTTVTFSAGSKDVTVHGVTIERVGVGSDSAFYDVGFLDPTGVEFSFGYLNAKHQVVLHDPFTIPAGTSQTYTIVGDMNVDLSANDGEMPALQLDSIQTDSPVSGSLPIRGTSQSVNASLVIGNADTTLAPDDPHGDQTRYIQDTGVRFAGIRIEAGSAENLRLGSINWEQTGSAASSDLANLATVVKGVSYPAETQDGRYYTSVFPDNGIPINKGESIDAVLKGDLTGSGANRTVKFDLYYASDIGLTGESYGFGIAPVPGGNTNVSGTDVFLTDTGDTSGVSLTPYFSGAVTSISPGAITGASKI
ncbi:MAG: hypothetical protein JO026_03190 [Patescibacteria group bacterium]|nr:hypothetical protein [Patescibacteria group bacterium]